MHSSFRYFYFTFRISHVHINARNGMAKKIIGPTLFIQLSIICSIVIFLFFLFPCRNGHRGLKSFFFRIFFFSRCWFGFEIIDRSGQEEKVWVKYKIKVNINCVCAYGYVKHTIICSRRGMCVCAS